MGAIPDQEPDQVFLGGKRMIVAADYQQGVVTVRMSYAEATVDYKGTNFSQYLVKRLMPQWGTPKVSSVDAQTIMTWTCIPAQASRLKAEIGNMKI
jgi:hypothetical protein